MRTMGLRSDNIKICLLAFCVIYGLLLGGCAQKKDSVQVMPPRSSDMPFNEKAVPGNTDSVSLKAIAPKRTLSIGESVFCTAVHDRVPEGISSLFDAQVGNLCFYTVVLEAERPTEIEHVWFRDNKEIARYVLPVNSVRWRTYSTHKIGASQSGKYEVRVNNSRGDELLRKECVVN